jgi:hypothetical protein
MKRQYRRNIVRSCINSELSKRIASEYAGKDIGELDVEVACSEIAKLKDEKFDEERKFMFDELLK